MAPKRVIKDSEDEESGSSPVNSPEKLSLLANPGSLELAGNLGLPSLPYGTGSTDSIFFQTIYENHLTTPNQQQNDPQSPMLESPITNAPMSSSPATSRSKPKRSKTMSNSPLTSLTEPTASSRKVKRTKSMKDIDDLTQITTPRHSKETGGGDVWEFLSSPVSDQQGGATMNLKSRNATLKTYGNPRRSKTMDVRSSTLREVESSCHTSQQGSDSPIVIEEESCRKRLKRPRPAEDDDSLDALPQMTRRRRLSVSGELPHAEPTEKQTSNSQEVVPNSTNLKGTGTTIQVPASTTEDARQKRMTPLNDSSIIAAETQLNVEQMDVDKEIEISKNASSAIFGSDETNTSMVIIPNILTGSQKSKYQFVNVESSNPTHKSSLPEMMERVDHDMKFTGDSSTIPNETPEVRESLVTVDVSSAHPIISSSSPSKSTASHKLKRSKSVAKQSSASSRDSKSSQRTEKLKRTRTVSPDDNPNFREHSVDELSIDPPQLSRNTGTITALTKYGKRKTAKATKDKRASVDEPFGSDEIGMPRESYQAGPSLRRSKSVSAEPVADLELHLKNKRTFRSKATKRSKSMGMNAAALDMDLKQSRIVRRINTKNPNVLAAIPQKTSLDHNQSLETFNNARNNTSDTRDFAEFSDTISDKENSDVTIASANMEVTGGIFENCAPFELDTGASPKASNTKELTTKTLDEDESSVRVVPTQSGRRGRLKKVLEDDEIDANEIQRTTAFSLTTEVQQGQQNDKSTTLAHSEVEDETEALIPTEAPIPIEKRRGRPKKVREAIIDESSEVKETQTIPGLLHVEERVDSNHAALRKVVVNKKRAHKSGNLLHAEEEQTTIPSSTKPSDTALANGTPPEVTTEPSLLLQTPTKEIKKRPDQHSPLQSGKVPYRVGLSKRKRIAPLLKIIRR